MGSSGFLNTFFSSKLLSLIFSHLMLNIKTERSVINVHLRKCSLIHFLYNISLYVNLSTTGHWSDKRKTAEENLMFKWKSHIDFYRLKLRKFNALFKVLLIKYIQYKHFVFCNKWLVSFIFKMLLKKIRYRHDTKKCTWRNLHNNSPLAPELSENTYQVLFL